MNPLHLVDKSFDIHNNEVCGTTAEHRRELLISQLGELVSPPRFSIQERIFGTAQLVCWMGLTELLTLEQYQMLIILTLCKGTPEHYEVFMLDELEFIEGDTVVWASNGPQVNQTKQCLMASLNIQAWAVIQLFALIEQDREHYLAVIQPDILGLISKIYVEFMGDIPIDWILSDTVVENCELRPADVIETTLDTSTWGSSTIGVGIIAQESHYDQVTQIAKSDVDRSALDHIAQLLHEEQWNADLLYRISAVVINTGRVIEPREIPESELKIKLLEMLKSKVLMTMVHYNKLDSSQWKVTFEYADDFDLKAVVDALTTPGPEFHTDCDLYRAVAPDAKDGLVERIDGYMDGGKQLVFHLRSWNA
jgi:hypothetical protein